jgi:ClpP class serine protease
VTPTFLNHREWLIQPEALQSMAASFRGLADPSAFLHKQPPESPLLSIEDGVGVIAIEGPILRKPDLFDRIFFGATSAEDIGAALRESEERDDIQTVFLDIDSPGGTVAGTPELAAVVAKLNKSKPVYAFSSGLMCSAAYWIASQARAIYATPARQAACHRVTRRACCPGRGWRHDHS